MYMWTGGAASAAPGQPAGSWRACKVIVSIPQVF